MHWTLVLMYAVMLLWLVPATLWRRPAIVLLAAWLIGQIAYWVTGNPAPVEVYIPVDIAAMILIYRFRESWMDKAILAIFPAMWIAYFTMPELQQWWTLYWLALTQFILAGPWPAFQKIKGSVDHGGIKEAI